MESAGRRSLKADASGGVKRAHLAAQAIDSHMLLELELLLLVPVTSCSEYTVSRRCAVIMRLLTTRGAQLSSCMSRVRICAVIPTQHTPTPPTYCLLTGSKISLKNRVESFRIAKISPPAGRLRPAGPGCNISVCSYPGHPDRGRTRTTNV